MYESSSSPSRVRVTSQVPFLLFSFSFCFVFVFIKGFDCDSCFHNDVLTDVRSIKNERNIISAQGKDSLLCYPGCPVDATKWRLSQAGNTSSPSVFSVVEMGSLLQVYAAADLNLPKKFMNTNGCGISFHSSSESQR